MGTVTIPITISLDWLACVGGMVLFVLLVFLLVVVVAAIENGYHWLRRRLGGEVGR